MGICPSIDPEARVMYNQNVNLINNLFIAINKNHSEIVTQRPENI